jgi:hypothetical protein
MAAKRVRVSHDIQREIRTVRNRPSLKYVNSQSNAEVPSESDVAAIQESERFMQERSQGDFIPLTYYPTKTSWPANGHDHRRTIAAGYDRNSGVVRIQFFTDNATYDYGTMTPIPPYVAFQFRQTQSPGRFINSTLEAYGYERIN